MKKLSLEFGNRYTRCKKIHCVFRILLDFGLSYKYFYFTIVIPNNSTIAYTDWPINRLGNLSSKSIIIVNMIKDLNSKSITITIYRMIVIS